MFWIQGLVCFVLWIGYGFVQSRRSGQIRENLQKLSRKTRALSGAALMLLGAGVLFGALIGNHALGGFTPTGMTPLSWICIALAGLLFVHAQTMAMAMLVTLMYDGVVTSRQSAPSDQKGSDLA
jgi:hypothetical protein